MHRDRLKQGSHVAQRRTARPVIGDVIAQIPSGADGVLCCADVFASGDAVWIFEHRVQIGRINERHMLDRAQPCLFDIACALRAYALTGVDAEEAQAGCALALDALQRARACEGRVDLGQLSARPMPQLDQPIGADRQLRSIGAFGVACRDHRHAGAAGAEAQTQRELSAARGDRVEIFLQGLLAHHQLASGRHIGPWALSEDQPVAGQHAVLVELAAELHDRRLIGHDHEAGAIGLAHIHPQHLDVGDALLF